MTRPRPVPAAPKHLTTPSRRLWDRITEDYVLEPHHLALLARALDALDTADAAEAIVRRDGVLTPNRFGALAPNPAVMMARDARAQFGTLMKMLGLDVEGPASTAVRATTRR